MLTLITIAELTALPVGSIVTTPFPDAEGNVAEKTSDGHWLITGEQELFTNSELRNFADADFTLLRLGYSQEQSPEDQAILTRQMASRLEVSA